MVKGKPVSQFINFSMKFRAWKNFPDFPRLISVRCYSDEPKEIKKEPHGLPKIPDFHSHPPQIKKWNEFAAVKKLKKDNKLWRKINNAVDFVNTIQLTQRFPGNSLSELLFNLKNRFIRKKITSQMFLPERVEYLRPDLAAAHFLSKRKGSVMFKGRSEWVSYRKNLSSLPFFYVPGYFVEKIDAEGTDLHFQGLVNLTSLKHLKWLSLKGVNHINDLCLDWISKEYYKTLEHLDISDCKNVTYRGLSCFYRFEQLKTLEVKGVPDTPEFKLACLKLQDIIPDLEITGIDLTVPDKIDPVDEQELKNLSAS